MIKKSIDAIHISVLQKMSFSKYEKKRKECENMWELTVSNLSPTSSNMLHLFILLSRIYDLGQFFVEFNFVDAWYDLGQFFVEYNFVDAWFRTSAILTKHFVSITSHSTQAENKNENNLFHNFIFCKLLIFSKLISQFLLKWA